MLAPRLNHRLLDIGWCVLVPLGAVTVYVGLGVGLTVAVGESILGTVLLGGAVIVLVGAARRARPRWFAYTGSAGRTQHVGRLVAGCAFLAFLAGQALALWLYGRYGSAGFDESTRARHAAGPVLTLLLALVVAPVAEEMVFRGVIYPVLRRRVGVASSVLLTAGVFCLLHGNVVQFASALPVAVLLGLVYERTRVLRPCVLQHVFFNLAATAVPAPVLAGLANPVSALLLTTAFAGSALILYRTITGKASPVGEDVGEGGGSAREQVDETRAA